MVGGKFRSRIGKKPINIPAGVTATINGNNITVKGPLGTLTKSFNSNIQVKIEGNQIDVINPNDNKELKKFHGLYRQIIANAVEGVSKGFTKSLSIKGVGYKASMKGNDIVLNIGFSHPVEFKSVEGIKFSCDKDTIKVEGIDKELVGQVAASIKALKPVEPYHGYGIFYTDEVVYRKEAKTGKK